MYMLSVYNIHKLNMHSTFSLRSLRKDGLASSAASCSSSMPTTVISSQQLGISNQKLVVSSQWSVVSSQKLKLVVSNQNLVGRS